MVHRKYISIWISPIIFGLVIACLIHPVRADETSKIFPMTLAGVPQAGDPIALTWYNTVMVPSQEALMAGAGALLPEPLMSDYLDGTPSTVSWGCYALSYDLGTPAVPCTPSGSGVQTGYLSPFATLD